MAGADVKDAQGQDAAFTSIDHAGYLPAVRAREPKTNG